MRAPNAALTCPNDLEYKVKAFVDLDCKEDTKPIATIRPQHVCFICSRTRFIRGPWARTNGWFSFRFPFKAATKCTFKK